MTISDDFKKLINDFAIKEEIKLHEKFWCLGNLKKNRELYTSLHHQQHIVFMRISKKAASKRKSSFNNV